MDMDEETFHKIAAAKGWTLLLASAQPTLNIKQATSSQPANDPEPSPCAQVNAPTGQDGASELNVSAPPFVPSQIRASAPPRPTAFSRSASSAQPRPSIAPPRPALSPSIASPADNSPAGTSPASAPVPTPSPAPVTTAATGPAQAQSSSFVQTTLSTRVARRTASGAPIGALANFHPATPAPAAPPAISATNEPSAAEISAVEAALLAWVREIQVKVEKYLGVDKKMMKTIPATTKLVLSRCPDVDMRETFKNQPIKSAVTRALKLTAKLMPEFQVYAKYNYWPLEIIAARILWNSANKY
ncbi:hypothetical protein RhiJN_24886 [Ceratobasidium sp. AG-Ba]|nr:hypothetical protein RhiJN_24886 [Ceratobasidium sp. AG-Ba]